MIIRDENSGLVIVYQTDHAKLSGKLCEAWGSGTFAKPDPLESVVFAAKHHDDGWALWEAHPTINPDTGKPNNFNEIPVDEHFKMYSLGVERVSSDDCYSGALVAMHARKLYEWRKQGGKQTTKDPDKDPAAVIEDAFNWLDSNIRYNCYRMIGDEYEYATNDTYLKANFGLIQAWDALALYLCENRNDKYEIKNVPTDYRGNTTSMTVKKDGDGSVKCDPYPFTENPFHVEVPARRLPNKTFESDDELRTAVKEADVIKLKFEFTE